MDEYHVKGDRFGRRRGLENRVPDRSAGEHVKGSFLPTRGGEEEKKTKSFLCKRTILGEENKYQPQSGAGN